MDNTKVTPGANGGERAMNTWPVDVKVKQKTGKRKKPRRPQCVHPGQPDLTGPERCHRCPARLNAGTTSAQNVIHRSELRRWLTMIGDRTTGALQRC